MYQGNVIHLVRTIACASAAAVLVALPAAARDQDDDRGRGGSHHQHGDHDRDGLAAELQALKARVRKLEGHLTAADVAGSYTLRTYQSSLISSQPPRVGRIEFLEMNATLQLNANGSFSFSGTETGFNAIWQFPTNRERVVRADAGGGTWAYVSDTLQLIFDGGEVVSLTGAVGGRMFLRVESNPADGSTTLVTAVKNQ